MAVPQGHKDVSRVPAQKKYSEFDVNSCLKIISQFHAMDTIYKKFVWIQMSNDIGNIQLRDFIWNVNFCNLFKQLIMCYKVLLFI